MTARLRIGLALSLLAAGALVSAHAAAQAPADPAIGVVRTSLGRRALWGRDYPLLIASLPAWAQAQEKTILVAHDLILGGTPFRSPAEAERRARTLRAARARAAYPLSPDFAAAAREAKPAESRVEVRRYGTDRSYRTVIGRGLELLPPALSIAEVQRVLGQEESVQREVEDGGGEHRPVVFTSHVWAGGAIVYQTSNYAPAPDQVVRVVLSVRLALRAVAEAR